MLTNLYWKLWLQFANLEAAEEDGAEAIEWIAMVAVVVVLLIAVQSAFGAGGEGLGSQIISLITDFITRAFG